LEAPGVKEFTYLRNIALLEKLHEEITNIFLTVALLISFEKIGELIYRSAALHFQGQA
jgi:hypothetical protein